MSPSGSLLFSLIHSGRPWPSPCLALLDFRKHGDSTIAVKSLKAALVENKLVPPYLLGRKKMPRYLPNYYEFGDENEAVLYVHGNKDGWKATSGALEWLAVKVK